MPHNTMKVIANEARRDQVIDNYILTQYSLKAGRKKFEKKGYKTSTMKDLQQMLTWEVFGDVD